MWRNMFDADLRATDFESWVKNDVDESCSSLW